MSLSLGIDLSTFAYGKMMGLDSNKNNSNKYEISVIIPAYNEEKTIEGVVDAQYKQTKQPKNVFLINDNSSDSTHDICKCLEKKYNTFVYIKNDHNQGKADNINKIVSDYYDKLGEIVYINDGDLIPDKNCLEELIKGFDEPKVAAVTGFPRLIAGGSLLSRSMTWGKQWQISVLYFRKKAQEYRNAMYVLCGAVTAYKKDILKKIPILTRTKTEDLDYTWVLIENGYKLKFQKKATAKSYDVVGMKEHWKQTLRWHSGAWQSIYSHGKNLNKAKGLLYTTLVPFWLDAALFTALPFLYNYNSYVALGIVGIELISNLTTNLISSPKSLKYFPSAPLYTTMCFSSYLITAVKTTNEKIMHKEDQWRNRWEKQVIKDPVAKHIPKNQEEQNEN